MGTRTVARLFGNHLQNVAMLAGLNVGFPQSFKDLFGWTRIFTIDLSALLVKLRLPTITQRLIFIGVSIILPLSLMVLTSLVFFSISSIVQIALMVSGLTLLVLHTISYANPDILHAQYNDSVGSETMLWVSFGAVFTVLLYRFVRRKNYDVASSLLWIDTLLFGLTVLDAGEIARRIVMSIFGVLFIVFWMLRSKPNRRVAACLVSAIVMGGIVYASGLWRVTLPAQIRYVGWVIVALGCFAIVSRVGSILSSSSGKDEDGEETWMAWFSKIRMKLQRLLDTGLLTIILFALSLAYAPVITNALQLFVCEEYSCPAGFAFNPHVQRPEDEPFTVSPKVFCEQCNFTSACQFSTYDLCPQWSSRRLLYDPSTTCDDKSYVSFIVAAVLVMFVFFFILNVMYVRVITLCTKVMCVKAKSGHQRMVMDFQEKRNVAENDLTQELDAPPSYEEKWEDTCIRVAPKASSLYDAYRYPLRYFILIEGLYKTAEVLATTFLSPMSPAASVVTLVAHLAFMIVLIMMTPLADGTEQWLSVILTFCMCLDSLYAIFMWLMPSYFGQDGWAIGMLVFNVLIPAVGGSYLLYVNIRNQFCRKTMAERKKEEEEARAKEAEKELSETVKEERRQRARVAAKANRREKAQALIEERRKLREIEIQKRLLEIQRQEALTKDLDPNSEEAKEKKKTTKELKREQMTPSEKLAESLNVFTKKIILLYFAFLSIPLLCAALVLTLISGSVSGNAEFVDASNLFDRSRETVLNDYGSWNEFSQSCCCYETQKFATRGSNITERWMCVNFANRTTRVNGTLGASYFRTRTDNAGNDGLPIRPLCGLRTVRECVVQVDKGTRKVRMECEPEYIKAQNITSFALEILW